MAAKVAPRGVGKPVQALPAVSKKPTTTATAKPNSISWACQSSAGIFAGSAATPRSAATQYGTAIIANTAAPR